MSGMSALLAVTVKCHVSSASPDEIHGRYLNGSTIAPLALTGSVRMTLEHTSLFMPVLGPRINHLTFFRFFYKNPQTKRPRLHRGLILSGSGRPLIYVKQASLTDGDERRKLSNDILQLLRPEDGAFEAITEIADKSPDRYAISVGLERGAFGS